MFKSLFVAVTGMAVFHSNCIGGTSDSKAVAAVAVARAALDIADEGPVLPDSRRPRSAVPDRTSTMDTVQRLKDNGQPPTPIEIVFHPTHVINDTLPAQLVIEHWERGCAAGDRLERDIRRQLKPLGWSIGDQESDQIRLVHIPQTLPCPQVRLLKYGATIRTWDGYQEPSMLSHELRRAWDEAPPPAHSVAAGPAGAIRGRHQIDQVLNWWRQHIGAGTRATFRWDRSGNAVFHLLARTDWSAKSVFGEAGRMELSAIGAADLPIESLGFAYRIIGSDLVFDVDPVRLPGLAARLGSEPASDVMTASPPQSIGILTLWSIASIVRDVCQILRPTCDLQLGGTVTGTAVLTDDTLSITFPEGPSIRIACLFQFLLKVERVDISGQSVRVLFGGSRLIRERTFSVD